MRSLPAFRRYPCLVDRTSPGTPRNGDQVHCVARIPRDRRGGLGPHLFAGLVRVACVGRRLRVVLNAKLRDLRLLPAQTLPERTVRSPGDADAYDDARVGPPTRRGAGGPCRKPWPGCFLTRGAAANQPANVSGSFSARIALMRFNVDAALRLPNVSEGASKIISGDGI